MPWGVTPPGGWSLCIGPTPAQGMGEGLSLPHFPPGLHLSDANRLIYIYTQLRHSAFRDAGGGMNQSKKNTQKQTEQRRQVNVI